jgi:predicted ATP-grasp superfamily ATP-dependent carboligase
VQKKLIIAATTARGYADAAVDCGYEVITLDAFADADLMRVASQAYKVKMLDWHVDVEDFKLQFAKINLNNVEGFCYGSLFDAAPELLDWVAARVQVIGNTPELLKKAKEFSFFELLDDLHIQHPDVRKDFPATPLHWLAKQLGGSGGMHVRPVLQNDSADYFQQEVYGESISMLFVANGKEMQTIGFNQQLVAPTPELPYRFAGAVGGVKLSDGIEKVFSGAATKLTTALGLRGICSLDAVLEGETLWILELNPRLSATFDLYPRLFVAHMQGCKGELAELQQYKSSCAQLILYADETLVLPLNFAWPAWVIDIPPTDQVSNNIMIEKNAPICSVHAQAETAELAFAQVKQRAEILKEMMQ